MEGVSQDGRQHLQSLRDGSGNIEAAVADLIVILLLPLVDAATLIGIHIHHIEAAASVVDIDVAVAVAVAIASSSYSVATAIAIGIIITIATITTDPAVRVGAASHAAEPAPHNNTTPVAIFHPVSYRAPSPHGQPST